MINKTLCHFKYYHNHDFCYGYRLYWLSNKRFIVCDCFIGTYAVQSVLINESSSILEVQCVFAQNTEATGCEVRIVFLLLYCEVRNMTMRANRIGNSAVVIFQKVLADEYHLFIFEIERNGLILVQVLTKSLTLLEQPFSSEGVNKVSSANSTVLQMISTTDLTSEFRKHVCAP